MRSLHTFNQILLVSGLTACLFTLFGCGPGGATEGGDSTESETGAGECTDAPTIGLVDISCSEGICEGRWDGTDAWSTVTDADIVLAWPPVDPTTVWECEPAPQVDGCATIDDLGHIGCFNIYDGWAVPVAPCCAAGADWQWIGEGLAASVHGVPGGDGDGDPGDGDGDGDPCGAGAPSVACTDMNKCWASDPGWTADAKAITEEAIINAVGAGIWIPADLDVGDECWALIGSDHHVCIVNVCGALLFGQPAGELPLVPGCDFAGVWESTAMAYDTCFGVIDGTAIELRDANAPYHAGDTWGPCPTINGTPTLCDSETIACVPADFGESNICLPLEECPDNPPNFSSGFELGWGNACYPRCSTDQDCVAGMTCAASLADGSSMCAWPR
jgi:hypothetical protein